MTDTIGHDLQAQVAGIVGYARNLGATLEATDETRRSHLEGILACARIHGYIVENLRISTTIEAGAVLPRGPGGALPEILSRLERALGRSFSAAGTRLKIEPRDGSIGSGADLLEWMGAHLLLAALQTSPEGGEVLLRGGEEGGEVRISVASRETLGPGLGGGLRLVEEAARFLGGRASRGPNLLEISLPLVSLGSADGKS